MAQLALINPARRKKSKAKRKSSRRRNPVSPSNAVRAMAANPKRKKRFSRRRRNPAARAGIGGMIQKNVIPAVTAAGGALGLDILWGMLPLPEQVKAGPMRHVAKAAGAIALGFVAQNIVKRETAQLMTLGMLTTITHSALREMTTRFAPQLALGMVNDELAAYDDMYMSAVTTDSLGYVSPNPVADELGAYEDTLSAVTYDM